MAVPCILQCRLYLFKKQLEMRWVYKGDGHEYNGMREAAVNIPYLPQYQHAETHLFSLSPRAYRLFYIT